VIGSVADANPPLDQFKFKPNQYEGNHLIGGKNAFAPAAAGFQTERMPAGWSEASELARLKPLTPADVGPDWVRVKK